MASKLVRRISKRLLTVQQRNKSLLGFSMHPATFADMADEAKANGQVFRCTDEAMIHVGVYGRFQNFPIIIDTNLDLGKINPVFSTLRKKKAAE
jgi:hypothetical protein